MKCARIRALIERYVLEYIHDWTRLTNIVYWPILDILIMGYTAEWLSDDKGLWIILACSVLWQVVVRANYDIIENLLLEIRELNISNLFSTPLLLSEWIVASIILGIGVQLFCLVGGILLVYCCYGINICHLGLPGLGIAANLMITGWTFGLCSCGFIIRDGERANKCIYMIDYALALLSGVYFAIDVLPLPFSYLARSLPVVYAFDAIRAYINGTYTWQTLPLLFCMNSIYFCVALYFFYSMFERSRNQGLSQLIE